MGCFVEKADEEVEKGVLGAVAEGAKTVAETAGKFTGGFVNGVLQHEDTPSIDTDEIENKADLNESQTFEQKVEALVREGKSRESAEKIVGSFVHKDEVPENKNKIIAGLAVAAGKKIYEAVTDQDEVDKSGYQTEAGNDQLGGQGKTEDDKDKREKEDEEKDDDEVKRRDHSDAGGDIHSMYNQNVGREASSGRKLKGDTTANQTGGIRGGLDPHVQGSGETNDINIVQKKPERNEEKGAPNIKVVKSIQYSLEKHTQTQQLKKIKDDLGDARGCTEHKHQ
jgi:hypothetical protein